MSNRSPRLGYWLVALSLLALLLAACVPRSEVRTVPTQEVRALTLEAVPGRTRIERFDPPGAGERLQLRLGAWVRNPNDFGVRLDRLDYRVLLDGTLVAEGTLEPNAFLEADGSAPVDLPIDASLPPRQPLLTAVARAFTGEPLPYRIEGRMRFSAGGHAFDVRDGVLFTGTLLPRERAAPPEVRHMFDDSRVFELRAGVPVVQLALRIRNPGEIGYFLNGKDLTLSLLGVPVGTMDLGPIPVPATAERRVELLFYPDMARLDPAAVRAVTQALGGVPTRFMVQGELAMDVLGVASFPVPGGLALDGFVQAE